MTRDKKVEHGQLRFVLPTALGRAELVGDVPPADIRAVVETGTWPERAVRQMFRTAERGIRRRTVP